MRLGFRRNTHERGTGYFRSDVFREPDTERAMDGDAGFLVHMLECERVMTREEIRDACAKYDADFPDTAPACKNLEDALLTLLEIGMAEVLPLEAPASL